MSGSETPYEKMIRRMKWLDGDAQVKLFRYLVTPKYSQEKTDEMNKKARATKKKRITYFAITATPVKQADPFAPIEEITSDTDSQQSFILKNDDFATVGEIQDFKTFILPDPSQLKTKFQKIAIIKKAFSDIRSKQEESAIENDKENARKMREKFQGDLLHWRIHVIWANPKDNNDWKRKLEASPSFIFDPVVYDDETGKSNIVAEYKKTVRTADTAAVLIFKNKKPHLTVQEFGTWIQKFKYSNIAYDFNEVACETWTSTLLELLTISDTVDKSAITTYYNEIEELKKVEKITVVRDIEVKQNVHEIPQEYALFYEFKQFTDKIGQVLRYRNEIVAKKFIRAK